MSKTVICPSCGAEFEETVPRCPYCGTMYYPAAEEEYMDQMEEIREQVDDLHGLAGQEVKAGLKKHGKLIRTVLIIAAVIAAVVAGIMVYNARRERLQEEHEYQWIRQHAPELDALYESGDYPALARQFSAYLSDEESAVWGWDRCEFAYQLIQIYDTQEMILEAENDPRDEALLTYILHNEAELMYIERIVPLTDKDKQTLLDMSAPLIEDMKTRFRYSDEQAEEIRKNVYANYGYLSYTDCEKMVKEFLKENPE